MEDIINSARRNCQHVALYPLKTQVDDWIIVFKKLIFL
jgi:hypothetical protein